MKTGLSTLFLMSHGATGMLSCIERFRECKVWEIIDDGDHALTQPVIEKLLEYSSSYGYEYTVHAPYTDINIASLNPYIREASVKAVETSLENARRLGAKTVTFHPGFRGALDIFYPERTTRATHESIRRIMYRARNLGVSVAIENMFPSPFSALPYSVEEFEEIFSMPEFSDLGFTLDIGHAHTMKQTELFLKKLGRKSVVVHLHDNDEVSDLHLGLGEGTVDWMSAIKSLNAQGFRGYIIIESISKVYESFLKLNDFIKSQP